MLLWFPSILLSFRIFLFCFAIWFVLLKQNKPNNKTKQEYQYLCFKLRWCCGFQAFWFVLLQNILCFKLRCCCGFQASDFFKNIPIIENIENVVLYKQLDLRILVTIKIRFWFRSNMRCLRILLTKIMSWLTSNIIFLNIGHK